jgi:hypothetical protein
MCITMTNMKYIREDAVNNPEYLRRTQRMNKDSMKIFLFPYGYEFYRIYHTSEHFYLTSVFIFFPEVVFFLRWMIDTRSMTSITIFSCLFSCTKTWHTVEVVHLKSTQYLSLIQLIWLWKISVLLVWFYRPIRCWIFAGWLIASLIIALL